MRILELIRILWKSPVYRIMLLLLAIGEAASIVGLIVTDDFWAGLSAFVIFVMFGELLWFTNIIDDLKNENYDD